VPVTTPAAICQALTNLVGDDAIQPAEVLSDDWQQHLSATLTPGSQLPCLVVPTTLAALAEVITYAAQANLRILPCGYGSKLSWGGLVDGVDIVVSTARLNRLIEHAAGDMTVTVEAGMGFAALQQQLASANQFVALDPNFPDQASLGGIIATRDAGGLRHRYGGVRDMVLGVRFIRADGQDVKAGGRVVKNVAGYDLMKLLTGSYGSLGIITELTLRLYPRPETGQLVMVTGSLAGLTTLQQQLMASTLTPTRLDLVTANLLATDLLANAEGLTEVGLLMHFQGIAASVTHQVQQLQTLVQTSGLALTTLVNPDQVYQHIQARLWAALGSADAQASQSNLGQTNLVCKLGCLPAQAIATLVAITTCSQASGAKAGLQLHTSNGVGLLRLTVPTAQAASLLRQTREICEQAQGYLTVLHAPADLKQHMDVWGYQGNALAVMRKLKQQFDPQQRLSPHRFVGGLQEAGT
jgi:glycolate oxidase FAD binding subunit